MRVSVYFNLHRKLFSVRAEEGPAKGLVVAHCTAVNLYGVQFVVNQAGRARVIREGRKNVHAFVRGELVGFVGTVTDAGQGSGFDNLVAPMVAENVAKFAQRADVCPISYNPHRYETFVSTRGGTIKETRPIHHATRAMMLKGFGLFADI